MYLGIDLGGTKIEAVVLGNRAGDTQGEIVFRKRAETPLNSYEATLAVIEDLVRQAERKFGGFDKVGLGTPGAISKQTGAMKNCNSTCLNGRRLIEDLGARLGKEIVQANDANCFALSEAIDGSAKAKGIVFGVILGTGVGGGIVVNQQVLQGINRISGEWGHNPLPVSVLPSGERRACYCGKYNCVETFLSGPGFVKTYTNLTCKSRACADLTAKQVAEQLERGEKQAVLAFDLYCQQLAAALAEVVNILDPEVIVLGGGMSNVSGLYSSVERLLPQYVFSDSVETQIKPPLYGDSSGVRGAAWLTMR